MVSLASTLSSADSFPPDADDVLAVALVGGTFFCRVRSHSAETVETALAVLVATVGGMVGADRTADVVRIALFGDVR